MSFSKISEKDWEHSGDCNARNSWSKDDWTGTCAICVRRFDQLSYHELPRPFYFDEGTGIWAWNVEHLAHLIKVFSGEPDEESGYSFYDAYLRKEWLKRKSKFLKVLTRLRVAPPGVTPGGDARRR